MNNKNPLLYIIFFLFFSFFILSCQKTGSPAANSGSGGTHVDTAGKPDSVYILTRIFGTDGSENTFGYDTIHHRYTYIAGNSPAEPDSTLILYNEDGTIFTIATKSVDPYYIVEEVSRFTYNSNKQISKIYTKPLNESDYYDFALDTSSHIGDITDPIAYVDSIVYDTKNRIVADYRILYNRYYAPGVVNYSAPVFVYYPAGVYLLKKFSYMTQDDSLLSRVDEYNVDAAGNISFSDSSGVYYTYDNKVNPFYSICPVDGLIDNYIMIESQPYTGSNFYTHDKWLHFSPNNCTSSTEDGTVLYEYNEAGLPIKCYYSNLPASFASNNYVYVKKPK